mgnify:CR=1 FL=1
MYTHKVNVNSGRNKAKIKKREWVIFPQEQPRNETEKYDWWSIEFKNWEYQIDKPSIRTEFAVKKGSKRKENRRVAKQMGRKLIKEVEQSLTFNFILFSFH